MGYNRFRDWGDDADGAHVMKRRPWALRIAALVVTIALPLAAVELAIESLLRNPAMVRGLPDWMRGAVVHIYTNRDKLQISMHPRCSRFDHELLYTLNPGECRFRNREFDTLYRINSKGLRDDEDSLQAPEIVVLGDSYAMGWGVAEEEAFPRRLAETTGFKVLNAGVASYGTAREYLLFRRLDRSNLKAIVIQYSSNDYLENKEFVKEWRLPSGELERYSRFVKKNQRNPVYFPLKYTYYILRGAMKTLRGGSVPPTADAEADAFLPILGRIVREVPAVPVIVFELSGLESSAGRRFVVTLNRRVGQVPALRSRVTVLDLERALGRDEYFTLDTHVNASGHRVVADRLAAVLAIKVPETARPG